MFTTIPSRAVTSSSRLPVHSMCLCKDDTELLCGLSNSCVVVLNIIAGEILRFFETSLVVSRPVLSIVIAQVKERLVEILA